MKRKTMGWLIVFLLFIVYMLNYMDRSALSITAPLIEKELGFNAAEMGMIFSAFFVGYALFNFIGGWASDKVGPKTVFLVAALLWSVFLWYDRPGHRVMDDACRTRFIWYGRRPG